MGRIPPLPFQSVAIQQLFGPLAAGLVREARLPEPQTHTDLVLHILGDELVGRVLEHDADMAVQLFGLHFCNVPALKQDPPRVGVLLEHREKGRGFAGAAGAENCRHTARREIRVRILHQKGCVVHRAAPLAAGGQPLADADTPELQKRLALCHRAGHVRSGREPG